MKITIEGARNTPTWETLEHALQEMLEDCDRGAGKGRLVAIRRLGQRASYRDCGTYDLRFEYVHFATNEVEQITLEVK